MMMEESPGASAQQSRSDPKRKTFILGGLLGLFALPLVGLAVWILRVRDDLPLLTESALETAKQRWETCALANYSIDVRVGGSGSGDYHVEVQDGQVVTPPTLNGHPIQARHTWDTWTVDGQFVTLRRELDLAEDPEGEMSVPRGTELILRARFHPEWGYPLRYRRLVLGVAPEIDWKVSHFEADP